MSHLNSFNKLFLLLHYHQHFHQWCYRYDHLPLCSNWHFPESNSWKHMALETSDSTLLEWWRWGNCLQWLYLVDLLWSTLALQRFRWKPFLFHARNIFSWSKKDLCLSLRYNTGILQRQTYRQTMRNSLAFKFGSWWYSLQNAQQRRSYFFHTRIQHLQYMGLY